MGSISDDCVIFFLDWRTADDGHSISKELSVLLSRAHRRLYRGRKKIRDEIRNRH